jgi:stage III sporulation protein AH
MMKKMFVIRKKNIVLGLLVILLIAAGYLNFIYNHNLVPVNLTKNMTPAAESNNESSKIKVSNLDDDKSSYSDEDSKNNHDDTAITTSSAFFRDYLFEREQERSKEVAYIKSIVENPNSDEEMVKEAQSQLLEITSNMESELVIENLIKAKGFPDAIVIIHRENVNVIVDKPELVPEEIAIILDIVKRESGIETNNIKIIPKI